jgi:hypothetical protein
MIMTVADAGAIAGIILGLFCLRRRRVPETAQLRKEQNDLLMTLEIERKPQA